MLLSTDRVQSITPVCSGHIFLLYLYRLILRIRHLMAEYESRHLMAERKLAPSQLIIL